MSKKIPGGRWSCPPPTLKPTCFPNKSVGVRRSLCVCRVSVAAGWGGAPLPTAWAQCSELEPPPLALVPDKPELGPSCPQRESSPLCVKAASSQGFPLCPPLAPLQKEKPVAQFLTPGVVGLSLSEDLLGVNGHRRRQLRGCPLPVRVWPLQV